MLWAKDTRLVAGLMSGTSLDGVDAVVARLVGSGRGLDIEPLAYQARIYASQKKYDEAVRIYVQLAHQQPQEADKFLQLAAEMRGLAGGSDD